MVADREPRLHEHLRRASGGLPVSAPSATKVASVVRRRHQKHLLYLMGSLVLVVIAVVLPVSLAGSSSPPHHVVLPAAHPNRRGTGGSPKTIHPTTTVPVTPAVPGSTTTTISPITTTTENPAVVTHALPPAVVPPVVSECSLSVTETADGNFTPLFCNGGGINVLAWQGYAKLNPAVMSLGPGASMQQVEQAMCSDMTSSVHATAPEETNVELLAARYYGWTFSLGPFFSTSCAPGSSSTTSPPGSSAAGTAQPAPA